MVDYSAGTQLGPYQFEKRLGTGAFAEVWLALEGGQLGFKKKVALKILKTGSKETDPHFASLVNEVRVCGFLHHPHIVDMYGVNQVDGTWVIAMEFVDGLPLDTVVETAAKHRIAIPRSIIVDLGIQIAQALDYAHAAMDDRGLPLGIVHRDLKPANVMLARRGGAKVMDFGIAKAASNVDATATGSLKGTPAYVAPEVWAGSREFLPRVDLFALGAILWELAMLRRLLDGGDLASLAGAAVLGNAEADANQLAGVFPEIIPVVQGLLERKADRRTQSAAEVVDGLRAIRPRVEAGGDIDLFFDMIHQVRMPPEKRADSSLKLRVPNASDPQWANLFAVASGKPRTSSLADTAAVSSNTRIEALGQAMSGGGRSQLGPLPPGAPKEVEATRIVGIPAEEAIVRSTQSMTTNSRPGEGAAPAKSKAPLIAGASLVAAAVLAGGWFALRPAPASMEKAPPEVVAAPATPTPAPSVVEAAPPPAAVPIPGSPPPVAAANPPAGTARVAATSPPPAKPPSPGVEAKVATKLATPTPAPAPAPTVVESTPAPAAPTRGCVALASTPSGAEVWLDGAASGLRARSGEGVVRSFPDGGLKVGMGMGGAVLAETTVQVQAGKRLTVRCDITGKNSCSVSTSETPCP